MTVSYSLDVAKARFCGLAQLLGRWKGGVYKIIWREIMIFCIAYAALSFTYRCYLDEEQKILFEKVVIFVETFTDVIPLSFVLGFYVSLVIGRWWSQYETIPWPDRVVFSIASYVHGSDERSRLIRRTLARYVILAKVLTFQAVSTSVKRRFPTVQHLVAAGIMTPAEKSVHDKISFPYGKWWLPLHWFTALATRARKEGRIKDSVLLNGLLKEIYDFRTNCAIMFGYDWISVPLVYTQVVTIATYMYSLALIVGRQYLDPRKGYPNHDVDLYVPFFTLLQFFFYIGWLKVAEQILNPYGEDDDDFELNWCLDRAVHLSYLSVDQLRNKHPKLEKDYFWDDTEPILPQTKESAVLNQAQLGSAFFLNVDDAEYLPIDELCEVDEEEHVFSGSVRRNNENKRPSLLRRILSSGFGQSQKKKSIYRKTIKRFSTKGFLNKACDETLDTEDSKNNTNQKHVTAMKAVSLNNAVSTNSPRSRTSSASFRPNSLTNYKRKTYELQDIEKMSTSHGNIEQEQSYVKNEAVIKSVSAPAAPSFAREGESNINKDIKDSLESDLELDDFVPASSEKVSKPTSSASVNPVSKSRKDKISIKRLDAVHNLVEDANKMLLELKRSMSAEIKEGTDSKNDDRYLLENSDGDFDEGKNNSDKTRDGTSKMSVVIEMDKPEEENK